MRKTQILLILLMVSCNQKKEFVNFYNSKKEVLYDIVKEAQILKMKYGFENMVLRHKKPLQVSLNMSDSNSKYFTVLINYKSHVVDEYLYGFGTTKQDKKLFREIVMDTTFKKIVSNYFIIGPKAIQIRDNGIFVALSGDPINKPANSDIESGLYISYNEEFKDHPFIEKIDSFAYIFQSIIH